MVKNTDNETKILTGDPVEDFSSFLKGKEKPFDTGLELIKRYTKNHTLHQFLFKIKEEPRAKKILLANIKIISLKWLKK